MRRLVILGLVATVAGCSVAERVGLGFGGFGGGRVRGGADLPYRTVLTRGDDARDYSVVARNAGAAPVEAVRESVRRPATQYCIDSFGASDAAWTLDPATGDWARSFDGADQIYSGRCVAR